MDKNNVQQLIDRYFEGRTSHKEEQKLKEFLCSPEAEDPGYDDIKAVLGFMETARAVHHTKRLVPLKTISSLRRIAAAAAVLLLIGGSMSLWFVSRYNNTCVAYIHGQKISNPEVVMGQMRNSMDKVLPEARDQHLTPESQLKDLFDTSGTGDGDVQVIIDNE